MNRITGELYQYSANLLSKIDRVDTLVVRIQRGGGNNKVFVLEIDGAPKYVMKQYFRHESDPRDRFRAEWIFLEYARSVGVTCVPKPIISDAKNGIAIFEYIRGRKITTGQLREDHISQALDFFESFNKKTDACIPPYRLYAADACLSTRDHLACVNRRIEKLLHIDTESEIHREVHHFIRQELLLRWDKIQTDIINQEKKGRFGIDAPLSEREICISPSDFGLHNAIETDDGTLFFIDFEYAGLDDPVKMICDFFCQPEVSIPHSYLQMFSTRVLEHLDHTELHYARLQSLLPVHTIKWCCLILNEFLPAGRERRLFADENIDIDMIQRSQLKKAKNLYERALQMS